MCRVLSHSPQEMKEPAHCAGSFPLSRYQHAISISARECLIAAATAGEEVQNQHDRQRQSNDPQKRENGFMSHRHGGSPWWKSFTGALAEPSVAAIYRKEHAGKKTGKKSQRATFLPASPRFRARYASITVATLPESSPTPLLLQKRAFRLTGRFRTPYNRGTHGGKVSYQAANTQWIYLPIVARIKQGRFRSPRLDVSL
jgi:hypothetical protein